MPFLIFILVYPFIWLLSILPFRVLYFMSDGFYVLVYYIIGYRKKVVNHNLKLAFPNKSEAEIKSITKKFYKHFVDVFIEMIKSFTISEKALKKRYQFEGLDVIYDLEAKQRDVIVFGGHYGNWEWIFILSSFIIKSKGYAIYKKLANPFFEKQIRKSRGRFNTNLITTKEIIEEMQINKDQHIRSIYGFITDQSPLKQKAKHWGPFFGVHVPIHTGAEFLAKKHELSVLTFFTKKIKRGYYVTTFKLLAEFPNEYPDYEITDQFLRLLEDHISEAPAYYLWTHKRFKHAELEGNSGS